MDNSSSSTDELRGASAHGEGQPGSPGSPITESGKSTASNLYGMLQGFRHAATEVVSKEDIYPWANVILIAAVIGAVEYIPTAVLAYTIPTKYEFFEWVLNTHGVVAMGFTNIALATGLVVLAIIITSWVPSAGGSGIPTLIAYLYNGVLKDNDMFSLKGVCVKMTGVVLSLTAGLIMGREGPAIHIGAAIGDLTNRLIDTCVHWYSGVKVPFDGAVKCNMVMMGSAAGFASAFRSPVGGMLFAIEELATHWDIKSHMNVGAQTFTAVAVAAFVIDGLVALTTRNVQITFSSIIIFDSDSASLNAGSVFHYEDIPGFLVTAIVCGVICGYNTQLAIYITKMRSGNEHWRKHLWVRALDAACVAIITAGALSFVPLLWVDCQHAPSSGDDGHRRLAGGGGGHTFVQYTCAEGDYSLVASLSLTGEEAAIRHLLSRDAVNFGVVALLIFLLVYLPLSLLVMGMPVPAGTFVPNLLLGSLIGRIVGQLVETISHDISEGAHFNISAPGVYALIGAASQLGAWTRTLIAIVVTLVEITGDVGVVVPLICCVVVSRGIASHISHHSYTHAIFYDLVDDSTSTEPPILHPNDWVPPVKKSSSKRRFRRTGSIDHGAAGSEIQERTNSPKWDFELGATAVRERLESNAYKIRSANASPSLEQGRNDNPADPSYYSVQEAGGRTETAGTGGGEIQLQHMQYGKSHEAQQKQLQEERVRQMQLGHRQSGAGSASANV